MRKLLLFLLAFSLGGGTAWLVLRRGGEAATTETDQDLLWTCGMHPQVLMSEPGNCPICGMKLVPVKRSEAVGHRHDEAAGGGEPGTVRIDPTFVQNIGVQSEEVRRTNIDVSLRSVGYLTYDDRQLAWVSTKYEGWIEKVYVNYVGERVERGQKLFEIYSPQLVTTQKEYLQAREYAERMDESQYPDVAVRAHALLASARERLSYWDITAESIEELEKEGAIRRTLAVVSPVSGVVVEKMSPALEGMKVGPGMNLYKLVDLSTIWVQVELFENQVSWLSVGAKAEISIPAVPGRTFTGRIRYVYPFFDEKTRTMKVSVELPNPGGRLVADMYAEVVFDVEGARNVLAVPEESVLQTGTRNLVVLDRGAGAFHVQEVELGAEGNGLWEVKSGLDEGDRVVVSAQFLIDSESRLREAVRSLDHQH